MIRDWKVRDGSNSKNLTKLCALLSLQITFVTSPFICLEYTKKKGWPVQYFTTVQASLSKTLPSVM